MKIQISNFTNLKMIDFSIQEEKLNFIYGISGSGKTSIATALTTDESDLIEYTMFGSSEPAKINTDEQIDFEIFNSESINEYIVVKSGLNVYDVLYGDNKETLKIKQDIEDILKQDNIKDVKNLITNQMNKIINLENELGFKRTSKGILSKTGFYKVLDSPKLYNEVQEDINYELKTWIKNGEKYIDKNICPFCNQSMSEDILERLKTIINELPMEYEKIINSQKILSDLGINVNMSKINEAETQENLLNDIKNEYSILKEMNDLNELLDLNIINDSNLNKTFKFNFSPQLIDRFNILKIDINELVGDLISGKENYHLLKKQYNGLLQTSIKKNINEINHHINKFGINYKFKKYDLLSREESYALVHEDSTDDSSNCLSTGERNIISLILFAISNKNNNVIIDDPASSYDEYKRDLILEFLFEFRYLESDKHYTTIVLSHDQIFLKFLTRSMRSAHKKRHIGNVFHLENILGQCKMKVILQEDMKTLSSHIKDRLKLINNYMQRVLNLRLLYETIDMESTEYKYLSIILHHKRENLTEELLEEKLYAVNTYENEIIKKIEEKTGIKLSNYNSNNLSLNISDLTKFEQLCYLREFITCEDKTELNNIVHFNYSLFHLLNPYKYNFQSAKSYSILKNNRDIIIQQLENSIV